MAQNANRGVPQCSHWQRTDLISLGSADVCDYGEEPELVCVHCHVLWNGGCSAGAGDGLVASRRSGTGPA